MPANFEIPEVLKHMAVAIYGSRDLRRSGIVGFRAAIDAARHRLFEYGFLTPKNGPLDKIRLTQKGKEAEKRHLMEGGKGRMKSKLFDEMFSKLRIRIEEGEKAPVKETPAVEPRDSRRRNDV